MEFNTSLDKPMLAEEVVEKCLDDYIHHLKFEPILANKPLEWFRQEYFQLRRDQQAEIFRRHYQKAQLDDGRIVYIKRRVIKDSLERVNER